MSSQYPLIDRTAKMICDNLRAHHVDMTDMSGKDDESVIPHLINADLMVSKQEKIRLTFTYDGWGLTLRHQDGSRTSFGKEVNFRSTEDEYYNTIANDVTQAVLAFTRGYIAAVIHLEKSTPKIVVLFDRTRNGYGYLAMNYTMNPVTTFFAKEDTERFYRIDGDLAMHPKCDSVEIMYDVLPIPDKPLQPDIRKYFEGLDLRSTLERNGKITDLRSLKPINQEVRLLDY